MVLPTKISCIFDNLRKQHSSPNRHVRRPSQFLRRSSVEGVIIFYTDRLIPHITRYKEPKCHGFKGMLLGNTINHRAGISSKAFPFEASSLSLTFR
ncbi:hypothetical protein V1477_001535 [Vespula maculifrons]|uniref:Uncharacterized protein n=1 Tax=Vespula maculifrons TaxID=7453 RepID=A0ABD2CYN9_VESMC